MTAPTTSAHPAALTLDFDACYRAIAGRDTRLDGLLYLGVTSTGIYCRPSCPARKPKPAHCRFFPSAAACVAAGFRACKRCRPEAVPGTRDWDTRGDLAARAVRRIRDGAIDGHGVAGLAGELAVSERHLHRVLVTEVGASPLQLARTRRAHAARALIEQTSLSLSDIAFAAGFGSLRQFGDTMREEFGVAPSQLTRGGVRGGAAEEPRSDQRPTIPLQLRTRAPFDAAGMRAFLTAHAVPGRDEAGSEHTRHAIDVPGGTAAVRIDWTGLIERGGAVSIPVQLELPTLADAMPAIATTRRLLDLDADPAQIAEALGTDARLGPLIAARPGLRLPGARHPHEFALGVVVGQQISLAAARTLQGRLAEAFPTTSVLPTTAPEQATTTGAAASSPLHPFPDAAAIAACELEALRATIGMPMSRATTLRALAQRLAEGLDLGPGADRELARRELAAIRGIGPWTIELIAMRSLGDPDAYPAGDLILRRALGTSGDRDTKAAAEAWRPYRGYATQHLWADFLATQNTPTHNRSKR